MRKLIFISVAFFAAVISSNVLASTSGVVIKSVQLGNATSASNEFIEIYNNSENSVDVTNWCIYYASASSDKNGAKISCLMPDNQNIHIFLPARMTMLAVSNQFYNSSKVAGDMKFDATLSGLAGHIRLIDSNGLVVDKIAWGSSSVSPEGAAPATVSQPGMIMERKQLSDNILQDTDMNADDFVVVPTKNTFLYGQIFEVQDICLNIPDIQTDPPDGYSADVSGLCTENQIDVCENIDGFQADIPENYGLDDHGDCVADVCANLDLLQPSVPVGYKIEGDTCLMDLLPIKVSEMLPNPLGVDSGNEYIEIFNPNDVVVNLENYVLVVANNNKHYNFPINSEIDPGKYLAFSDGDVGFNLVNSSGGVSMQSIDGQIIDESINYIEAGDGVAWALINGLWQYTNQPTRGSENLPSIINEVEVVSNDGGLKPCAPNQYRSPETNRCRLIPISTAVLAPCKAGQYRSEETNRCRSIVNDVVSYVPCAEGQERNPLTNRCRSVSGAVLGSSTLKPCKVGQERNPETNRCRNIKADIAKADYKPEQSIQKQDNSILIFSIIGIAIIAVGYGIWEWRVDILKLFKKIKEKIIR